MQKSKARSRKTPVDIADRNEIDDALVLGITQVMEASRLPMEASNQMLRIIAERRAADGESEQQGDLLDIPALQHLHRPIKNAPLATRFNSAADLEMAGLDRRKAARRADFSGRDAQSRLLRQIMEEDKKILAALAK